MANTATALTAIPAVFRIAKPDGLIFPVSVHMDALAADLEVFAASAGRFWAIYGAFWNESAVNQVQIKSGSTVICAPEFSANGGMHLPLKTRPYFLGQTGEALNFNLVAGVITQAIIYVAHQAILDMYS